MKWASGIPRTSGKPSKSLQQTITSWLCSTSGTTKQETQAKVQCFSSMAWQWMELTGFLTVRLQVYIFTWLIWVTTSTLATAEVPSTACSTPLWMQPRTRINTGTLLLPTWQKTWSPKPVRWSRMPTLAKAIISAIQKDLHLCRLLWCSKIMVLTTCSTEWFCLLLAPLNMKMAKILKTWRDTWKRLDSHKALGFMLLMVLPGRPMRKRFVTTIMSPRIHVKTTKTTMAVRRQWQPRTTTTGPKTPWHNAFSHIWLIGHTQITWRRRSMTTLISPCPSRSWLVRKTLSAYLQELTNWETSSHHFKTRSRSKVLIMALACLTQKGSSIFLLLS